MIGYQYVILRCVPNVDRAEFVNVGVVLYCQDAGFLGCEFAIDEARLDALAPGLDVDGVRRVLDRLRRVCNGEVSEGPGGIAALGERFGWIIAPRSTVVQPGPVHGGLCDDPAHELARLMVVQVRPPGDRKRPRQ